MTYPKRMTEMAQMEAPPWIEEVEAGGDRASLRKTQAAKIPPSKGPQRGEALAP